MQIGDIVDNRYRLVEVLGKGSTGTVWRAEELLRDQVIGTVAVKFVYSAEILDRIGEVTILSRMSHPHILGYRTVFETDAGIGIVTEFADGGDASMVITGEKSAPDLKQAVETVIAMADALRYLREHKLVHRDVKPSNILFVGSTPKLADFGLIKEMLGDSTHHTTMLGALYCAPEMFSGRCTHATDIYCLATTMFHLVTGEPPYTGSMMEIMNGHTQGEIPQPAHLPEEWNVFFRHCLAKAPDDRWTPKDVLEHFRGATDAKAAPALGKAATKGKRSRPQDSLSPVFNLVNQKARGSSGQIPLRQRNKATAQPTPATTAAPPREASKPRLPFEFKAIRNLEGHRQPVETLHFHPRGKFLYSGGRDHQVITWDMVKRTAIAVLKEHSAWITSIDTSPDGRILATGSYDATAVTWNAHEVPVFRARLKMNQRVDCVRFAPHQKLLATGSADGILRIWDHNRMKVVNELVGHRGRIRGLAFSPDGQTLVSGGEDGTVRTWSIDSSVQREILPCEGTAKVIALDLTVDGRRLAIGRFDGHLEVRDLVDGTSNAIPCSHGGVQDVAFTPDGQFLFTVHTDHSLCIWDLRDGGLQPEPARRSRSQATAIAVSPTGDMLAEGGRNGVIRSWEIIPR